MSRNSMRIRRKRLFSSIELWAGDCKCVFLSISLTIYNYLLF
jgi:hypothetical protein